MVNGGVKADRDGHGDLDRDRIRARGSHGAAGEFDRRTVGDYGDWLKWQWVRRQRFQRLDERWLGVRPGHRVADSQWLRLLRNVDQVEGSNLRLTDPFFDYDPSTGIWAGTSGYFNYTVTVSKDGRTFTGKENGKFGVPGPNPYAGGGTSFSGFTLSATKIEVDKSLLP